MLGAFGRRSAKSKEPDQKASSTSKDQRVTVRLTDGQQFEGTLESFLPDAYELSLSPLDEAGAAGVTTQFQMRKVAFVAYHKDPEKVVDAPPQAVELRVHVAGGASVLVKASRSVAKRVSNFTAYPAEVDSPYGRYYFFAHGVKAKENPEHLGSMLVKDGVVDADEMDQIVSSQAKNREQPLGEILVDQNKVSQEDIERARVIQERKRVRIGEVLVDAGLLTDDDVTNALAEQKNRRGKRLGQILVEMGSVTEEDLFRTLAKKFNMPFVDLNEVPVRPDALGLIEPKNLHKHCMMPIHGSDTAVILAVSDPLDTDGYDMVRFKLDRQIREVLAMPGQIKQFLDENAPLPQDGEEQEEELAGLVDELAAQYDQESHEAVEGGEEVSESSSAIARLVNRVLIDAYRKGASDIHIEPNGKEQKTRIRFRIDGECMAYDNLPPQFWRAFVSRIKILAGLDISERRKPQDGKIKLRLPDKQVELRVATIPTVNANEDVVMRILADSKPIPIEKMGMSERNLREFCTVVKRPYGLILCVGPTGSGKTTTLHSALGHINVVGTKIWTAEDPVEITQAGLRQVQVHAKIGFTFAAAMRAFLRADPDVIMIGEMRDEETASIAVEASLTGHVVFSTLHTNSAPETVTRLLDMGLDPFTFADALLAVLAQRLARRLCKECKEPYVPPSEEYEQLMEGYGADAFKNRLGITSRESLKLYRPKGCDKCNNGYKGRLALHELLVTDDDIKEGVQRKLPVSKIRDLAIKGGMTTLLQDGIEKILAGHTDLKQVLSVCMR